MTGFCQDGGSWQKTEIVLTYAKGISTFPVYNEG